MSDPEAPRIEWTVLIIYDTGPADSVVTASDFFALKSIINAATRDPRTTEIHAWRGA